MRSLIDPVLKIKYELETVVLEERENIDEQGKVISGLELNYERRSISYLCGGGLLPEPEFRSCPFCNHAMVDEPLSNQSVVAENDIIIRECESNLKISLFIKKEKDLL